MDRSGLGCFRGKETAKSLQCCLTLPVPDVARCSSTQVHGMVPFPRALLCFKLCWDISWYQDVSFSLIITSSVRMLSHSVMSDSLPPQGLQPARLLCLWNFTGNNTAVRPFPTPGDLPNPGIESPSLTFPALAGRFFTTAPPGKPRISLRSLIKVGFVSADDLPCIPPLHPLCPTESPY